jgi:hypothetical protein
MAWYSLDPRVGAGLPLRAVISYVPRDALFAARLAARRWPVVLMQTTSMYHCSYDVS